MCVESSGLARRVRTLKQEEAWPCVSLLPSNYPMRGVAEYAKSKSPRSSHRSSFGLKFICGGLFACVLASLPFALAAQQSSPPPSDAPAQEQTVNGRQPGAGTQLQTGTASGLDADARLQNLLADHQYAMIDAQLGKMPPEEAQIYRGILANRSNHLEESIKLLEPIVEQNPKEGNGAHEKELRESLAEHYLRLGQWNTAAAAYQSLESSLKNKLTQDEQDAIEMPLRLLPLIRTNPPATIEPCDPFKLQVSENPLGLVD